MHQRPEVGDQGVAVILRAGVTGHRVGEFIDGLVMAVQGYRMQRDGDSRLFKGSQFCLYAQPLSLQPGDPLLGVILGNHVLDHEIDIALLLAFDAITFASSRVRAAASYHSHPNPKGVGEGPPCEA